MRIGISVVSHSGQNIWENGLGQNVIFLARLLQRLPFVRNVVLMDVGDQNAAPPQVNLGTLDLRIAPAADLSDEVDVIIEMAGALPSGWLALQRERGKKVVYYCAGQPFAGFVENCIFNKPVGFATPDRCDEVWSLPKDAAFAPMQRLIHRCPVRTAPYIWESYFLEQRVSEIEKNGLDFGWAPSPVGVGLRVAIFEPNISVVKSSVIPMLACDEAYREDRSSVSMMLALNTMQMKNHDTLLYLANSLDLVRDSKAVFLGRHDIVGFAATEKFNAVISHQWENDQNYIYMDALYGDYPLIHNSSWLRSFGAGYYYPDFEALEAGRQLLNARSNHAANLSEQRAATQKLFAALSPDNELNLAGHAELLKALCHDRQDWLRV